MLCVAQWITFGWSEADSASIMIRRVNGNKKDNRQQKQQTIKLIYWLFCECRECRGDAKKRNCLNTSARSSEVSSGFEPGSFEWVFNFQSTTICGTFLVMYLLAKIKFNSKQNQKRVMHVYFYIFQIILGSKISDQNKTKYIKFMQREVRQISYVI